MLALKSILKILKSNTKLTHFEEITLQLIALNYDFKDKLEILKNVSKLIANKELFDESKFEFIQAVVEIEISNLLSEDEQKEIGHFIIKRFNLL